MLLVGPRDGYGSPYCLTCGETFQSHWDAMRCCTDRGKCGNNGGCSKQIGHASNCEEPPPGVPNRSCQPEGAPLPVPEQNCRQLAYTGCQILTGGCR
jgi:hypothetical protein